MNTEDMNQLRANADAAIERIVREHSLAVNSLTEKQVVELLKQLFASGDIIRNTMTTGNSETQSVIYIPLAMEQELSGKLQAVRKLCEEQHSNGFFERGVERAVPCECLECALKREILELIK